MTETIITRRLSRMVRTTSEQGNMYYSRLYVDNGNIATLSSAKHKTRKGAIRWAKKILLIKN